MNLGRVNDVTVAFGAGAATAGAAGFGAADVADAPAAEGAAVVAVASTIAGNIMLSKVIRILRAELAQELSQD